jgi:hypothetical protein
MAYGGNQEGPALASSPAYFLSSYRLIPPLGIIVLKIWNFF